MINLALQDAEHYMTCPVLTWASSTLEEAILIGSFTSADVIYTVFLNEDISITKCTCPYITRNCMVCNHMFMVERLIGCAICQDSGVNGESLENSSQPSTNLP